MTVLGKSRHVAVVLVVLVLAAALIVPEAAFAFGPGPPAVYLDFTPKSWAVGDGCPATYTVRVASQELFKGSVNLTVINPPKGVSATFNPNPVDIPVADEGISYLTMKVSPDVPYGIYRLDFNVTALPSSNYDRKYGMGINGFTYFTINVGSCMQPQNQTLSTTSLAHTYVSISTTTQLSTVTSTATTTEHVADPSTYAWAVSATAATVVLAVVLLLQRRTR